MLSVCDVTGVVSRAKSEGPARCVCGSPPARAVSFVVCCKIVRTHMLLNPYYINSLFGCQGERRRRLAQPHGSTRRSRWGEDARPHRLTSLQRGHGRSARWPKAPAAADARHARTWRGAGRRDEHDAAAAATAA